MEPSRNERKLPWRKIILGAFVVFVVFTTFASWGLYKAYTLYKTSEEVPVFKDAIASPMHTIIIAGDRARFEEFLSKKTIVYDLIEGKGALDCRPLMMAVVLGRTEFAEGLIKRGADINAPCINFTPLELAIVMRYEPMIRLLHSNGAATSQDDSKAILSPYAAAALSPLNAEHCFNTFANEYPLFEHAKDVPAPADPKTIVLLIKELYGISTLNAKDASGRSPLFIAAQDANEAAFDTLLSIGADYRSEDLEKDSILSAGARSNCESCVRQLIALKLDVNQASTQGMTPLAWAATEGSLGTVRLLLEAGAKKNLKISGATAAELAEQAEQFNAAELIKNFKPSKKK